MSGYSAVDRVWVALTNTSLPSFTSWPFTIVQWILETMVWVLAALRSSPETMAWVFTASSVLESRVDPILGTDGTGTYVEDTKDPIEIRPSGGNFLFVVPCMEMSRNYVSLALLGDLHLDLSHSPEIRRRFHQ